MSSLATVLYANNDEMKAENLYVLTITYAGAVLSSFVFGLALVSLYIPLTST